MFKLLSILAIFSVTLTACQKEEEVFPAPSVSSSGTLAGIIGATVQVKATINAPAGIKSITVLKNGASFDGLSQQQFCKFLGIIIIHNSKNRSDQRGEYYDDIHQSNNRFIHIIIQEQ